MSIFYGPKAIYKITSNKSKINRERANKVSTYNRNGIFILFCVNKIFLPNLLSSVSDFLKQIYDVFRVIN